MTQSMIEQITLAQKVTLGQVDNGMLATAVTCADTLAIVRHGRVESYVVPVHIIEDLLNGLAVLECDKRLSESTVFDVGQSRSSAVVGRDEFYRLYMINPNECPEFD